MTSLYLESFRLSKVQEGCGDFVVVVAEDVAFVDEVAGDGFDAEGADAVEVGFDGLWPSRAYWASRVGEMGAVLMRA